MMMVVPHKTSMSTSPMRAIRISNSRPFDGSRITGKLQRATTKKITALTTNATANHVHRQRNPESLNHNANATTPARAMQKSRTRDGRSALRR